MSRGKVRDGQIRRGVTRDLPEATITLAELTTRGFDLSNLLRCRCALCNERRSDRRPLNQSGWLSSRLRRKSAA
jgi:hypothetical protein